MNQNLTADQARDEMRAAIQSLLRTTENNIEAIMYDGMSEGNALAMIDEAVKTYRTTIHEIVQNLA